MRDTTDLEELLSLDEQIRGEGQRETKNDKTEEVRRLRWKNVMGSSDGAFVLREILSQAHLFRTTYVRGDASETAFQEGRRSAGLWLLAKLGDADKDLARELLNAVDSKEKTE